MKQQMKKMAVLCILILSTAAVFGNTEKAESRLMIQLGSGGAIFDDKPVISLNGVLTYGMTPWINVGIEGSVFHTLERQYQDSLGKTYQAELATSMLFLQPHWAVNNKWDLGIKLGTGTQLVQFRYEEALRDNLVWTEEFLDKLDIPSLSASFTVKYSLCPIHSLQVEVGYRNTKETPSQYTDQNQIGGTVFGTLLYGFRI